MVKVLTGGKIAALQAIGSIEATAKRVEQFNLSLENGIPLAHGPTIASRLILSKNRRLFLFSEKSDIDALGPS